MLCTNLRHLTHGEQIRLSWDICCSFSNSALLQHFTLFPLLNVSLSQEKSVQHFSLGHAPSIGQLSNDRSMSLSFSWADTTKKTNKRASPHFIVFGNMRFNSTSDN